MKRAAPAIMMPAIPAMLAMLAMLAACGPGDGAQSGRSADAGRPSYPASFEADGLTLSGAMLARGDSVFHGWGVGSVCAACHGRVGAGSPMVRPLTDNTWAHTDGSFEGILDVTRTGVQDAPTPMPPMGGASLSPDDLEAVTAYVYWLSRRDGRELRQADAP